MYAEVFGLSTGFSFLAALTRFRLSLNCGGYFSELFKGDSRLSIFDVFPCVVLILFDFPKLDFSFGAFEHWYFLIGVLASLPGRSLTLGTSSNRILCSFISF